MTIVAKSMFNKKAFIIFTFVILLAGNILGLMNEFRGLNSWNLNKMLNFTANYYSFSSAKWYAINGMWRHGLRPGPLYAFLSVMDILLMLSGLVAAIFFLKAKSGRLFLIFFLIITIVIMAILTIKERGLIHTIYRDYIPSGWETYIGGDWRHKCLVPRSVYLVLSGLSIYIILDEKWEAKSRVV